MNEIISEDDLLKIFLRREKKKHRHLFVFNFLFYSLVVLVSVAAVYTVINFPAINSKIGFWYKTDMSTQTSSTPSPNIAVPVAPPDVPTPASQARIVPTMDNFSIAIPVLDIKAPVTFGVNNKSADVAAALENGAIQINGTALPGQMGNMYITGHSSNYIWAKGNYNSVFALLDKLVVGDMVYVKYNDIIYEYQIYDQKIVYPKDTSVLKTEGDSHLTLVTCWPVGTSLKRVVVLAKQIYPDPAHNSVAGVAPNFQDLTSGL